jgi:protein phosphatase
MSAPTLKDRVNSNHHRPRRETAPPARVSLEVGAATHPGKLRGNNEDQFLVARLAKSMKVCMSSLPGNGTRLMSEEEGYLFAVADGMGGEAAGETASTVAIESVEDFVLNTFQWFLHQGAGGREEAALSQELSRALAQADRAIIDCARSNPRFRGMGTTLTMAYSVGSDLFLVHAGDTRAYLFQEGDLQQLTKDHTLVQLLVDHGALSAEQAEHDKRRHVVTNALGGHSAGVHAEIHKLKIVNRDILLLCSDGLSEVVSAETIARVLLDASGPDDACNRLIDLALSLGAPDDVTVVVARYIVP